MAPVMLAVLAIVIVALIKFRAGNTFGSASFASWPGESEKMAARLSAGIVLGKAPGNKLAGWSKEGHWLIVAPTGAGKSTGVLIPSIKMWGGSCMAIDVKGELASACAPILDASGIKCRRIDPFGLLEDGCKASKVGLDPVALAASAKEPVAAFRRLSEILIDPPGLQDAHWAESARVVTAGLLAAASVSKDKGNRGLAGVAGICKEGHKAIAALGRLTWPSDVETLLSHALKLLEEASVNQRGAILSTISRQFGFLSSPEALTSVSGNWDPSALLDNDAPVALFVVLPAQHVASHARLLRVVTGCVIEAMLAKGPDRKRRILLAIDEAAALGRLEAIEQGIGLYRGYGATFLLSFQDDSQMVSTYGEQVAGTIRSNCNLAYWSMSDLKTAERVSTMIGNTTVLAASRDIGSMPMGKAGETSQREAPRPLMAPDELMNLPADKVLCFVRGNRPSMLDLIKPSEAIRLKAMDKAA